MGGILVFADTVQTTAVAGSRLPSMGF